MTASSTPPTLSNPSTLSTTTAPAASAGDLLSTRQRGELFRVYNYYRLVLGILLIGLLLVDTTSFDGRFRQLDYFQAGVIAYLAVNAFIAVLMIAGFQPSERHISVSILLDILIIHGLLVSSSGITNGMANLVIVSVAAGNIMTPGRMGTFYAALATLSSLAIALWAMLEQGKSADDVVRAGSLGIVYFVTAAALQYIAIRLRRSETLANSHARSLAELEQINQQIIQRMRTGILVLDREGQVRLMNAAANEMLAGYTVSAQLAETEKTAGAHLLPASLLAGFKSWLLHPQQSTAPFQPTSTLPPIQATFAHLNQNGGELVLMFLEDISRVTQQAQQIKLASLGQLTANIAHEIRNPLGAISHAAQLLDESPNMDTADQKMLAIIHRHSKRVNAIIENVLGVSRRETSAAEPIDLQPWLEQFRDDFLQTHSQHKPVLIRLSVQPGAYPTARFDTSQLEQILINLCDNGLRYSQLHSGEAKIEILAGIAADGARAYIDIKDYGPGIAKENTSSVFEPFFTTDKSGTGLGLYLAKELCEANQAHLSLINAERPGCCFRIMFAHPGRVI
ncbi:sensor histidine kinase [Marinobacter sp. ELB17]|uniref:sensor histidine kinase n=1 Tax=Marinobacter sp. ELB17 TaxID=270374 RepID=UPI0002F4E196|nr:ATP-binding protein [Marinobacter sp. ELB17]